MKAEGNTENNRSDLLWILHIGNFEMIRREEKRTREAI